MCFTSLRQMTNWGSRMFFARLAEQSIRKARGKQADEKLGALDRVFASSVGGALGCWNQPIEVRRSVFFARGRKKSSSSGWGRSYEWR